MVTVLPVVVLPVVPVVVDADVVLPVVCVVDEPVKRQMKVAFIFVISLPMTIVLFAKSQFFSFKSN